MGTRPSQWLTSLFPTKLGKHFFPGQVAGVLREGIKARFLVNKDLLGELALHHTFQQTNRNRVIATLFQAIEQVGTGSFL